MRKKEERKNNPNVLINLYLNFLLNKKIMIIMSILMFFLIISLIYISKIDNEIDYLGNPNSFHQSYFNLALLLINILNSVLISFFVINLSINSLNFDILFISYIKRYKLSIYKLLTIFLIMLLILLIEFVIIMLIALLRFKLYVLSNMAILTFLYNYIAVIFELLISIGLTEIFNLFITPLFVLFIFLILKILMNNYVKIKELFFDYIPYITYNSKENIFEFGNPLIIILLVFALIFIYIQIYSIKDIK